MFKSSLLVNLGISLGGVIMLTLLIFFLGSDIGKRVGQIQEKRKELVFRTQAVGSLAQLKMDSEKAAEYSSFLMNVLPPRDKLIEFSKDLEGLAKRNDVDLGFSFGAETLSKETEPGAISFAVTTASGYNNFLKFLKAIETSQYFVGFDAINLERKDKDYKSVTNGRVFSR